MKRACISILGNVSVTGPANKSPSGHDCGNPEETQIVPL